MRKLAVLLAASGALFAGAVVAHVGVKQVSQTTGSVGATAAGTCAWCHAR